MRKWWIACLLFTTLQFGSACIVRTIQIEGEEPIQCYISLLHNDCSAWLGAKAAFRGVDGFVVRRH